MRRSLLVLSMLAVLVAPATTAGAQTATDADTGPDDDGREIAATPHDRIGSWTDGAAAGATEGGTFAWTFDALGERFDLELESNNRLVTDLPAGYELLRGSVTGSDDSWVRLTETPSGVSGLIFDGDELFVVEPAAHFDDLTAGSDNVVYRAADAPDEPLTCDVTGETYAVHPLEDGHLGELLEEAEIRPAASSVLRVIVVEDQDWTGDSIAVFNAVDGIYDSEVDLNLRITSREQANLDYDDDPLDVFREYMGNRTSGVGIGHLMAGDPPFAGSVVGKAYINALCRSYGVGVSAQLGYNSMVTLVAHEIGHNASASHDTNAGCPSGFIMAPSLNGSRLFSDCSKTAITEAIARAGCLLDGEPAPGPSALAGSVTYPDGSPAEGVVIDLFADTGGGTRGQWLGDTRTGSDGSYRFEVDDGCYVVTFIAPDGGRFTNGSQWLNDDGCASNGGTTTIDASLLGAQDTGSVAGTVSRNGSGVSGVVVDLFAAQADGSRGAWLGDTTSGADGGYDFDVPPGCYVLTFIAPAGQTFANGSRWYQAPFCVDAGGSVTGVDAALN